MWQKIRAILVSAFVVFVLGGLAELILWLTEYHGEYVWLTPLLLALFKAVQKALSEWQKSRG